MDLLLNLRSKNPYMVRRSTLTIPFKWLPHECGIIGWS